MAFQKSFFKLQSLSALSLQQHRYFIERFWNEISVETTCTDQYVPEVQILLIIYAILTFFCNTPFVSLCCSLSARILFFYILTEILKRSLNVCAYNVDNYIIAYCISAFIGISLFKCSKYDFVCVLSNAH